MVFLRLLLDGRNLKGLKKRNLRLEQDSEVERGVVLHIRMQKFSIFSQRHPLGSLLIVITFQYHFYLDLLTL